MKTKKKNYPWLREHDARKIRELQGIITQYHNEVDELRRELHQAKAEWFEEKKRARELEEVLAATQQQRDAAEKQRDLWEEDARRRAINEGDWQEMAQRLANQIEQQDEELEGYRDRKFTEDYVAENERLRARITELKGHWDKACELQEQYLNRITELEEENMILREHINKEDR